MDAAMKSNTVDRLTCIIYKTFFNPFNFWSGQKSQLKRLALCFSGGTWMPKPLRPSIVTVQTALSQFCKQTPGCGVTGTQRKTWEVRKHDPKTLGFLRAFLTHSHLWALIWCEKCRLYHVFWTKLRTKPIARSLAWLRSRQGLIWVHELQERAVFLDLVCLWINQQFTASCFLA